MESATSTFVAPRLPLHPNICSPTAFPLRFPSTALHCHASPAVISNSLWVTPLPAHGRLQNDPRTCLPLSPVLTIRHAAEHDETHAFLPERQYSSGESMTDVAGIYPVPYRKKGRTIFLLMQGKNPIEILQALPEWKPGEFWGIVHHLAGQKRFDEVLQVFSWWKTQEKYRPREQHYINFIRLFGQSKRPDIAQQIFDEIRTVGLQPGLVSYAALIHSYADCSLFDKAEDVLQQMRDCGINPNAGTYNGVIYAYGKQGRFDDMNRLLNNMKRWACSPDYRTYSCMIVSYAKAGLLRRMEKMWREMDANGWKPDFATVNTIIQAYASHGLLEQMHASYMCVKEYRLLVNQMSIRAMAMVYIQRCQFHQLRIFVKDVGLNRNNVENLLWNLLLLSYAANFQMKNLQRCFQEMKEAGFNYDLTTFNIRALSFSRMHMFWDLHITLIKMRNAGIPPDLVTFGAVVDAYISGRHRFESMFKELDEIRMKEICPDIRTDPLVFEAFGKGDFHDSSEILMKMNPKPYGQDWTYGLLLSFYLRKRGAGRMQQKNLDSRGVVTKRFMVIRCYL